MGTNTVLLRDELTSSIGATMMASIGCIYRSKKGLPAPPPPLYKVGPLVKDSSHVEIDIYKELKAKTNNFEDLANDVRMVIYTQYSPCWYCTETDVKKLKYAQDERIIPLALQFLTGTNRRLKFVFKTYYTQNLTNKASIAFITVSRAQQHYAVVEDIVNKHAAGGHFTIKQERQAQIDYETGLLNAMDPKDL